MKRLLLTIILIAGSSVVAEADWKDDIGLTSLAARLGGAHPTGTGVAVSQIEAASNGTYMPNVASTEFTGKTITAKSGASGTSSHANTVATYYYGLTLSGSPGINPVDCYEANDWLNSGMLRVGLTGAPLVESRRIQNHSWIGSFASDTTNNEALRRLDLLVARDGVFVAVGVNNGAGTVMPKLLSSAYNVVAVGMTNGGSSYGPTVGGLDGAGRVKPDIVVPASTTSWGTPMVAGSASLLLETADALNILPSLQPAARRTALALLTKSLLMAGATKSEFANWRKGFATPTTDGTVPLDYRYGVGELNIDNSHWILSNGQQAASGSATVATTGWDFGSVTVSKPRQYFFEVPFTRRIDRLSVVAAWNRSVSNPPALSPSLANIDLRLYGANGLAKGPLKDASVSTIDNIEHIYLVSRAGGQYLFELTTNQTWDCAVAWQVVLSAHVSPDVDRDGDVDGIDYGIFSGCFNGTGNPIAPACAAVDFNGDDHVDGLDYGIFAFCFNGSGNAPACP